MSTRRFESEIKVGWIVASIEWETEYERAVADMRALAASEDFVRQFDLIRATTCVNNPERPGEICGWYYLVPADHEVRRADRGPLVVHFERCNALRSDADELARRLGWTLAPLGSCIPVS